MEFSSANFMKLTIQNVSDLLMQDITPDKQQAGALLYGKDDNGKRFKLSVVLMIDGDWKILIKYTTFSKKKEWFKKW